MTNLKMLAEEVSKDYMRNGIPMNESIAKMAEDRALNKHQIDRVVEHANQLTYLSLFNKGQDKYASVDFDVADPKAIKEILSPKEEKKTASFLDDYKDPEIDLDSINFFGLENTEKIASELPSRAGEFWTKHGELSRKFMHLKARSGENRIKFNNVLDKFAHEARVNVLRGKLKFEELNSVFPEDFVEKVAQLYSIPGHEKTACEEGSFCVNEDHSLITHYNNLSKLEDEYIDILKEAKDLHEEAEKLAAELPETVKGGKSLISGIAADIAKAWNVIKEVPAKHLVGYPAAFLLGVMYQKSKEDEATLSGSDVPLIFRAY